MTTRIAVVIGANGQLGSDLVKELQARRTAETGADPAYNVIGLLHSDLEVCDAVSARETLSQLKPDAVFNMAAFHRVDDCEDDPERAFRVNAAAPANLARICRDLGSTFVHISSDYVFAASVGGRVPTARQTSQGQSTFMEPPSWRANIWYATRARGT